MAKKNQPATEIDETKHLEVVSIVHNGIRVNLRIDYNLGELSLLESSTGAAKKWVFSGRTLDYLDGWLSILEAMQVAVRFGQSRLEHDLAERSRFVEDLLKEEGMKRKR
jgi:hypothetical protein